MTSRISASVSVTRSAALVSRCQDRGVDQAQRRDAALVAGLHGVLERVVDIVAQHGYGLSQIRPRAGAGAQMM